MVRYFLASLILFSFSAHALTFQEALDSAVRNNNKILAVSKTSEAQKFSAEALKNTYFPKAEAGYNYQHSSEKAYGYIEEQFSRFGIEVTYNLFNGMSDKADYEAALKLYDADKFNEDAVVQDVVLSVKKAYIEVLRTRDAIAVAEKAVQLLESQLKDAKLFCDAGFAAKNEILRVEAELSSSRQSLLSANSAFKVAVFSLENVTGLTIAVTEKFTDMPVNTDAYDDMTALRDAMLNNRSELKYLKTVAESQDLTIKSIKGGYLPKVNVGAAYYTYGQDPAPYDRDYTYDTEALLSASLSVNLFDGFAKRNKIGSVQAQKLNVMYQINDAKASMELQLKTALERLSLAKSSLDTALKEVDFAKENYRITQNQFKQKVATGTDLLDARVMLTRAENAYTSARYDIQKAQAEIERVIEKKGP